ncbi:MAG TPA: ABC transporter permease [Chloroflexota bacterium]|nr:ABC transporter permease [Chloroflexota bacterium]
MNWLRYVARQLGFSLLALWFIVSLTFFLRNIAGMHPLSPAFPRVLPSQEPLLQQYLLYLWNAAHFNFGPSLMQVDRITGLSPSASSLVLQALPWTLLLVGPGTIISFVLGSLLGIVLAWHRGSAFDTWATAAVIFVTSIPYYFAAIVLVFFVTLNVPWFPQHLFIPGLLSGFSPSAIGDLVRHMILPVTAIGAGLRRPLRAAHAERHGGRDGRRLHDLRCRQRTEVAPAHGWLCGA